MYHDTLIKYFPQSHQKQFIPEQEKTHYLKALIVFNYKLFKVMITVFFSVYTKYLNTTIPFIQYPYKTGSFS